MKLRRKARYIELYKQNYTSGTGAVLELDSEVLQLEHDYNSATSTFEPQGRNVGKPARSTAGLIPAPTGKSDVPPFREDPQSVFPFGILHPPIL